jgi:hypothetical protein
MRINMKDLYNDENIVNVAKPKFCEVCEDACDDYEPISNPQLRLGEWFE